VSSASFLTELDVTVAAPLFAVAMGLVFIFARRLTSTVDALADRTQLGRSLVGSILLGASTSLPGIVVTVVATLRGDVALAVADAVGGVAAQTTFLAMADIAQRRIALFRKAPPRRRSPSSGCSWSFSPCRSLPSRVGRSCPSAGSMPLR
jgi:Ca2+/Na+ antiporter